MTHESAMAETQQQQGFMRRNRVVLGAAAAGLVVVGALGVEAVVSANDNNSSSASETTGGQTPANACETLEFTNSAANANRFSSTGFLPINTVKSSQQAETYVNSLFGTEGPIGGKADKGSIAAVKAVITNPALTGSVIDPNYSYTSNFDTSFAALNTFDAANNKAAAVQDCKDSLRVMVQLSDYNPLWAKAGEKVTAFIPHRNKANQPDDLEIKKFVIGAPLSGVEITNRQDAKNIPGGVPSTLIDANGVMYVKGFVPEPETGKTNEGQPTTSPSPQAGEAQNNGSSNGTSNSGNGNNNGTSTGTRSGSNSGSGAGRNGGSGSGEGSGSGNGSGGTGTGSGSGGNGGGTGGNGGGSGGNGGGNNGGGTPTTTPGGGGETHPPTPPVTKSPEPGCDVNIDPKCD